MAKLIGYDLDGIERDVREETKDWGGHPITIERKGSRLDIYQPGMIPLDGYEYLDVTATGYCHLHWSFPRYLTLEEIVKRHAIVDESAPVAAGEQG